MAGELFEDREYVLTDQMIDLFFDNAPAGSGTAYMFSFDEVLKLMEIAFVAGKDQRDV